MPLIRPHPNRDAIMKAYASHSKRPEPRRGLISNAVEPIRKEFQVFGVKGGLSNLGKRAIRLIPGGGIASMVIGEPKSVETARWKAMHAVERWKEMQDRPRAPRDWQPPALRSVPEEHARVIRFNPEQAERFRTLVEREPLGPNPLLEERLRKRAAALERRERRVA